MKLIGERQKDGMETLRARKTEKEVEVERKKAKEGMKAFRDGRQTDIDKELENLKNRKEWKSTGLRNLLKTLTLIRS